MRGKQANAGFFN